MFSPNVTFSYWVCFVDPVGLDPREQVFCKLLCFKMFCLAFHLVFHGGHFSYLSKSHDVCVLADGSLSWSSETVFQLCRPIVALLFLVLGSGQPGWVAQALLGPYVCRRMPQTRDRVPLQVWHVPACHHWAPCGVVPTSHVGEWGKKKTISNSVNFLHNENHCDLYIYPRKILLLSNLWNNTIDSRFV